MAVGTYQLRDGSDYEVALKDDRQPHRTYLKSTIAVDVGAWE